MLVGRHRSQIVHELYYRSRIPYDGVAKPAIHYLSSLNHNSTKHLKGLSETQLRAVTASPSSPLQIVAGPGAGKTRVLTSRIAEFTLRHFVDPSHICALTFTRRAAGEMRKRLVNYIGAKPTAQLELGTFHSICLRLTALQYIAETQEPGLGPFAAHFKTLIARTKALPDHSSREIFNRHDESFPPNCKFDTFEAIYNCYQSVLSTSNALDFEDVLVKGVRLIEAKPGVISHLKAHQNQLLHRSQDTSGRQYDLVKKFAQATGGHLSIVGDPDQSSIQLGCNTDDRNFDKMKQDFPGTESIFLEENYRSSASILSTCHAIVSQDKQRIERELYTNRRPNGPVPTLKGFFNQTQEFSYIARELRRVVDESHGSLGYGDCAILVRRGYMSAGVEAALKKEKIPTRKLPQLGLFDYQEVKNVLAYLRLANTLDFTPGLLRILQMLSGVTDTSITDIMARAIQEKATAFNVVENICNNTTLDVYPPIGRRLRGTVGFIRQLNADIEEGALPADLLRNIIKVMNHDTKPRSTNQQQRYESMMPQLVKYAEHFMMGNKYKLGSHPTRAFLEAIKLQNETIVDTGEVTISTCHYAKGLEWPVVFVPGVQDGIYPDHRSNKPEKKKEDRRVLYVAGTRAQCLLYFTSHKTRKSHLKGPPKPQDPPMSEFLRDIDPTLLQNDPPDLNDEHLQLFRGILGRKHNPAKSYNPLKHATANEASHDR
ncbi:P-loop containing nucleoside triphosphate hydrolase protein [Ceratobasidium sp. AG-I]|nr:P-loop containing nucleoside triphosphate hydrolase protein [Ceratobasidium sp. AG-I]